MKMRSKEVIDSLQSNVVHVWCIKLLCFFRLSIISRRQQKFCSMGEQRKVGTTVVLVVVAPSFGEEVNDEIKCWLIIFSVLDKLNVTSVIVNQISVTDSCKDR